MDRDKDRDEVRNFGFGCCYASDFDAYFSWVCDFYFKINKKCKDREKNRELYFRSL